MSARTCRFDPGRRYSNKDKVFEPCLFFFVVCRVTNFFHFKKLFVNCSGLMKSYNLERTKFVLSFFKIIIFLSLIPSIFVIKFNCSIRFFLMRVWSLFHYRSYGAFFLQQNGLHNSYSCFTHYRNYRANFNKCVLFVVFYRFEVTLSWYRSGEKHLQI